MIRLAEGRSFKFVRFDTDFMTTALTADQTTLPTSTRIPQDEYNLFQLFGRVMVPPVFWGKMAYFYTSGTNVDKIARLVAYQWSDIQNGFEIKCSKDMSAETSQNLYHKYTLANLGDDGVLFKENAGSTFYRYLCDPDTSSWTVDAEAITTVDMNGLECGVGNSATITDVSAMTLLQARYDPDTYAAETIMDIYGLNNDLCIMKISYSASSLTVSEVIDLETRAHKLYTVTPEHFDVTQRHIALMSPVQCDEDELNLDTEYVTSPSVDVFNLSTQIWSCVDIEPSDRGTYAWTLPLTDVST